MRYTIITYGCQMNEADSGSMARVLDGAGWTAVASAEEADLVVINTCSVREKPERKAHALLGELHAMKERRAGSLVAVAGCMAQREGRDLVKRARHVDIVLGTRCFQRIAEAAERALAGKGPIVWTDLDQDPPGARCEIPEEAEAPLRAYVPVILGCTNFCSYCIVPRVRGPETSRPAAAIREEVRSLVSRGTREVTLLGQNVLAYGRDHADGNGPTFAGLLGVLDGIEGLWRIRFLTCHPRDVSDELIKRMSQQGNVCEHIHLPIQGGTDRLLREMNRGYTTGEYLRVVGRLRDCVPGIAITTDIMVGFPGEGEEDFEESLRLYERIGFDAAFTFAYSPRPQTRAAERGDQVPREVKLARLERLIEAQNRITVARNQEQAGQVAEVLVEGEAEKGDGLMAGRTRHNKQAVFAGEQGMRGSRARVRLLEGKLWGFRGELAEQEWSRHGVAPAHGEGTQASGVRTAGSR